MGSPTLGYHLHYLVTHCSLQFLAFNSSGNSNQGWTHSSNIVILSCSLSELNEGRTKEILCLAIRPTSLLILIWALFSVGNPVGVSPMMVTLSSGHRVTILFLVRGLRGGSDCCASALASLSSSSAIPSPSWFLASASLSSSSSLASLLCPSYPLLVGSLPSPADDAVDACSNVYQTKVSKVVSEHDRALTSNSN